MKWYVYRKGYNAANNALRDGRPETMLVATVEAESEEQAVDDARAEGRNI